MTQSTEMNHDKNTAEYRGEMLHLSYRLLGGALGIKPFYVATLLSIFLNNEKEFGMEEAMARFSKEVGELKQ